MFFYNLTEVACYSINLTNNSQGQTAASRRKIDVGLAVSRHSNENIEDGPAYIYGHGFKEKINKNKNYFLIFQRLKLGRRRSREKIVYSLCLNAW